MQRKTRTTLISLWSLTLVAACMTSPLEDAVSAEEPASRGKGPDRRALLIGINNYSAAGIPALESTSDAGEVVPTEERRWWQSLEGAVNDVEGMHATLTGAYGFPTGNVLSLIDQKATRGTILRSIDEHLIEPSGEGDIVVFYYSGHGSFVDDPTFRERDGRNETIVPADSKAGAPDIQDKELRQAFNRILDKGASLVVILDSCHSGSAARGLPDGALTRALEPSARRAVFKGNAGPPIESRGALVLSASQADEPAQEADDETGRPYGAFTLALLRALRVATAEESAAHVFERTLAWLGATGRYQRPVLEALPERRAEPLFGGRSDHRDGAAVIAAEPYSEGEVRLLGGRVNGLAVGSELRRFGAPEGDELRLRVTKLQGMTYSLAKVSPEGRKIDRGELFELTSWVAPDVGPLQVWMPDTPAPEDGRRLARELETRAGSGKFVWVEDPTEQSPSHVLRWRGGAFELIRRPNKTVSLGPRPKADQVTSHLDPEDRLFVQLPAPADLLERIELGSGTRHSAVELSDDPRAAYHLVGRWHAGAVELAWIRPQAIDEDSVQGLPVRSAWHVLPAGDDSFDRIAYKLEDKALRLAKIHGWLNLKSPSQVTYPYRLALAGNDGPVTGGKLLEGPVYRLIMETADGRPAPPNVEDRFVYFFSIDGDGNSVLLYPQAFLNTGNAVPGPVRSSDGSAPARIDLGEDSSFDVVGPFGHDTFFLVTTVEKISDPRIFAYPGVRGDGPDAGTALARLLARIGSTRRGSRGQATSLKWSIERKVFATIPAQNTK